MRRKTIIMMSVVAATILQIFLSILLVSGNTSSVHTHAALALSLIPTPSKPNDSSSGLPPIILVALIGFGGIVVGGLITGGFTLYQTRRNAQLERERLLLQLQTQHQQA
jgi:hypothetical protein